MKNPRPFFSSLFNDPRSRYFILAVYVIAAVAISLLQYFGGEKDTWGGTYTHYNNYVIFKSSFTHLVESRDLYLRYPEVYADHFKYSPSFALLMAPFTLLPDLVGLTVWNLLNALVLFFSIQALPGISTARKGLILLFVFPELVLSVQNSQSNALIAGLFIFCFTYLERRHVLAAAIMIALSVYIKLLGIVALILFVFYPRRWTAAGYLVLTCAVLGLIPLTVVSPGSLLWQYENWGSLLSSDHSGSFGISVMGWMNSWFGLGGGKEAVLVIGGLVLCLPLLKLRMYNSYTFRLLALSSILIWVVIFNHKAESPSYIIAVMGVAIWYSARERGRGDLVLLLFVLVFTILSSTDLVPRYIRSELIQPYMLKALPCIVVWCRMIYEMLRMRKDLVAAAVV